MPGENIRVADATSWVVGASIRGLDVTFSPKSGRYPHFSCDIFAQIPAILSARGCGFRWDYQGAC